MTIGLGKRIKDHRPTVSIIIPVYNDPMGIRITLISLLAQTYPTEYLQILVVDNGSEDDTKDVIERFEQKYDHITLLIESEAQGSYAARNKGIREATGEILAFIDADMTVNPDWIERGIEYIIPDADYLGSNVKLYTAGDATIIDKYNGSFGFPAQRYFQEKNYCLTGGLFVRASVFEELGPFDSRLISGGDGEFGTRVHQARKEQRFARDLVVYHPTRSTLKSMVKKRIRIGRGFYQRTQFHPDRYGHPSWSPTDILPLRPWVVKAQCRKWDQLHLYQKVSFYFIAYILKFATTIGRVKQAIETKR